MAKQPKPEFQEFAERLVATCCAVGMSKERLKRLTGLQKSRLNSYEDATRFPAGKEITMADGALRKISRALGVLSIWLTEGEHTVLRADIAEALDQFDALPYGEQVDRANRLGWWLEQGRPRKRPSK